MRVTNTTRWNTVDLRRIFLTGLKEIGVNPKRYCVKVVPAKSFRVGGYAYIHCGYVHMSLPGDADKRLVELAQVFVHEVHHTLGLRHGDMATLRPKTAPKPKPIRDVQAERAAHARKMLAKHEQKLKREQRLVRKWRQKARYYEKVFEQRKAAVPRKE